MFAILIVKCLSVPEYGSWILGNSADFVLPDESVLDGGILLAGGSTDQDEAMKWFLRKARGGDVIIFRNARIGSSISDYPTADGYNSYMFSELGVKVDSVETILLNSLSVSNNLEVAKKVRNAEAIFFTGGDQATYWLLIKNTELDKALNYAINTKRVVIGGTSAGCAIQGQYLFSAENDTITTTDALNDPYTYRMSVRNDLFKHAHLQNTITDTHYNNPDRRGRHITFMARILVDNPSKVSIVKGIGVEERTAVCVEGNGNAYVFSSVGNYAHFLIQNKISDVPESCAPKTKLDWYRNREAIHVYKISGNKIGDRYFDLSSWRGIYYINKLY